MYYIDLVFLCRRNNTYFNLKESNFTRIQVRVTMFVVTVNYSTNDLVLHLNFLIMQTVLFYAYDVYYAIKYGRKRINYVLVVKYDSVITNKIKYYIKTSFQLFDTDLKGHISRIFSLNIIYYLQFSYKSRTANVSEVLFCEFNYVVKS